jgi:hypothetical protein
VRAVAGGGEGSVGCGGVDAREGAAAGLGVGGLVGGVWFG